LNNRLSPIGESAVSRTDFSIDIDALTGKNKFESLEIAQMIMGKSQMIVIFVN
jgi:hypothetical protein